MTPRLVHGYRLECATAAAAQPALLEVWRMLLSGHEASPERIYQTPEYFSFLQTTSDGRDRPELYVLREGEAGRIVGILPVRGRRQALEFSLGSRRLMAPQIRVVAVLGSVPLIPNVPGLLDDLVEFLLDDFPEALAVSFSALPYHDEHNDTLRSSPRIRQRWRAYVLHGWRACHTIVLPTQFAEYQNQFSAKKRYNLNRQIRKLAEWGGPLQLQRLDRPEHVDALMAAQACLLPGQSFMAAHKFAALAERGLLLSYVLQAGAQPLALILGTRSAYNWHIHNIGYWPAAHDYSPGTSVLHLAIEDVIAHDRFTTIDLGYGSPAHRHSASNTTVLRGHVLLMRRGFKPWLLALAHRSYSQAVARVKRLLHALQTHRDKAQPMT